MYLNVARAAALTSGWLRDVVEPSLFCTITLIAGLFPALFAACTDAAGDDVPPCVPPWPLLHAATSAAATIDAPIARDRLDLLDIRPPRCEQCELGFAVKPLGECRTDGMSRN
jgi:hypothetical protein